MTMIQHHPADDLLLAMAAGSLPGGPSLVVATHVEACAQCRSRLQLLEAAGAVVLEDLAPETLSPQALTRTLAAIDALPPEATPARPVAHLPAPPEGMVWPRALQACTATRWRWLGPGMRWSRVALPADPQAKLFLLRIGAGMKLARHTHSDTELTQVLHGSFHDGRALFEAGDFDQTDGSIHHQPVVQASGECICLASIEGRMLFDGAVARTLGALIDM
ncbi:ChrR family anti-sigma-E factor [Variovorax humicola]|uniref:ChrR family anti-sigma-E factor n=1 Tax=Variovorax humicola TaxID=1769758 RepID=A0ABU8W0I0_9BURK